ncbi:MAG: TonB family protein [Candidatus Latescibacteria bacterium]|nr:TonB family protein [Candidatus Latescibacterota bacterium]
MKKSVLISLIGHLLALASFAIGFSRTGPPPPLPSKARMVSLVNAPGEKQRSRKTKGEAKPSQAAPKTETVKTKQRTGQKVEKAPSTEAMSPKGTKKPAKTAKQQPKAEVPKGNSSKNQVAEGLSLDNVDFDDEAYLTAMVDLIKEEWRQPVVGPHSGVLKTTIFFTILKDGSIDERRVWESSGDNSFDRSALSAVYSVQLPVLPEGFKGDQLGVYLDFTEN